MSDGNKAKKFEVCPRCCYPQALESQKLPILPEIELAGLKLVPMEWAVYVNGEKGSISVLDFRLLRFMLENKGVVVARKTLLDTVWNGTHVNARTIDAHFVNLRRLVVGSGVAIHTIYGAGYQLVVDK